MMPSVEYLGHRISEGGIHPNEKKKRAILQVPAPRNLQQLRSFLGMVNYYGKFLPHLASTLTRLYSLLKKCTLWHWDRNEDEAFKIKKPLLTLTKVLTPYDPDQKLISSCLRHQRSPFASVQ